MSHNPWSHAAGHAVHAANHGSKAAAVFLIVFGVFLTPALIGIPMVIYGLYKLCQ